MEKCSYIFVYLFTIKSEFYSKVYGREISINFLPTSITKKKEGKKPNKIRILV